MTTTKKATLGPWTDDENTAIVALYFEMLDYAIPGKQYTKAGLIRIARGETVGHECDKFDGILSNRSKGSIEAKLMNCSAAHRDCCPTATTMDGYGYRCLSNYQGKLKFAMAAELDDRLTDHGDRHMASSA